jgi:predicted nucleic acid-binding protein
LVIDAGAALYVAMAARPTPGLDLFDLMAPPIFRSEALSGLSAAVFRGALPETALEGAFERLEAFSVTIVDHGREHRHEALTIARSLGWAKTYDAEYVALARRLECELLTTDERLERGANRLVKIRRPASLVD